MTTCPTTTHSTPMRPTPRALARWAAACLIAVLVGLTPGQAEAQGLRPDLSLSPALIGTPDPSVGVRGRAEWTARHEPTDFAARLILDAPLTLDPDDNPESLEATLSLTALILDLSGTDLTGPPGAEPPDRGALRFGIEGAAEASQRLDDADLTVGVTVLYDHASPALWYVPGIALAYDLAQCVGCDVPASDDDRYHRIDLRADWSIPLDALTPEALDGLRFRPAGRWFQAWGVGPALAAFRREEGLWARLQLAYHTEVAWLHEVYVSWRAGDLPVRLQEDDAWSIGVTLIL